MLLLFQDDVNLMKKIFSYQVKMMRRLTTPLCFFHRGNKLVSRTSRFLIQYLSKKGIQKLRDNIKVLKSLTLRYWFNGFGICNRNFTFYYYQQSCKTYRKLTIILSTPQYFHVFQELPLCILYSKGIKQRSNHFTILSRLFRPIP